MPMIQKALHHNQVFTYDDCESDIALVVDYIKSMDAKSYKILRNHKAKGDPEKLTLDGGDTFYAGTINASMRVSYDEGIFTNQ